MYRSYDVSEPPNSNGNREIARFCFFSGFATGLAIGILVAVAMVT